MEWENMRIPRPPSPPNPIRRTPCYPCFTDQALRSGNMGPELGRAPLEHFRDYDHPHDQHFYPHSRPGPSSYSRDIQDAIYREIEKEHIRDEIIMFEMVRRRALEAEVRRELMIERELALRRGNERYLLGSTSLVGFDSPMRHPLLGPRDEGQSMEKRIVPTLLESNRHEIGGYDALMAPRGTGSLRISEVDPVAEIGKEKEKIIFRAKSDQSISGLKRKDMTPPLKVDAKESPSDYPLWKKSNTEWNCDICHITTTSEKGLKDHLQGKKHKAKEDAKKVQIYGKNYCIGFCPKKDTNPFQLADLHNEQKTASGSLQIQKAANASSEKDGKQKLQENQNPRNLKRSEKVMVGKGGNPDVLKKKFKFWCDMCQTGAYTEEIMNAHKQGKKHARCAQNRSKKGEDCDVTHKAKN